MQSLKMVFTFQKKGRNFPGGPGGKTVLSMQGTQVQLLVRELDHQIRVHMLQQRPGAAKINKCLKKKKKKRQNGEGQNRCRELTGTYQYIYYISYKDKSRITENIAYVL